MTPEAYVATIVIPTLQEALKARGDRRLVYLACISIFHIIDYVAVARGAKFKAFKAQIEAGCGVEFGLIQGVCNGAKHAGGEKQQWIAPGSERDSLPFGFGPGCGGFDEGRWDHPGLSVSHEGHDQFLDIVAQQLLLRICRICEPELGMIDLVFLDDQVLAGEQTRSSS